MGNIIVIGIIVAVGGTAFAMRSKDRKNGKGCCGNCRGCMSRCGDRK